MPTALPWHSPTVLRSLQGPAARAFLSNEWPELYAQDPHASAFQAPGWMRGRACALPPSAELEILVTENLRGEPEAALALQREHHPHGRPRLRPLGTPHAEYIRAVGPATSRPAAMAVMAQHLLDEAHLGTQVVMPDLPDDSCLAHLLGPRPGWRHSATPCAAIPLPLNTAAMSRTTRRTHLRRERTWGLLADQGRVEFSHTQTADELAAAAATAQDLHRRRWAGQPALHHDDTDLAAVLSHCGPAEAFAAKLRLDGETVAVMLCLFRGATCYSLLPAMRPEAADLAPGHSLIRHLAQALAQQGFTRLDLGRTIPSQISYKRQYMPEWTTARTALSDTQQ